MARLSRIASLLAAFALSGVCSSAIGAFLKVPFPPIGVMMAEGPQYSDDGSPHLGAGFAFDYVAGDVSNSSTWQMFPVLAAAEGAAIRSCEGAGPLTNSPFTSENCDGGYGHFILIRHNEKSPDGKYYYTLYAHLDPTTIDASIPQRHRRDTSFEKWKLVKQGDRLGMAGQSGKKICRGDCIHLHFEVFQGGYFENATDPYDISTASIKKSRTYYPEFSSLVKCGSASLWINCPTPPRMPKSLNGDLIIISDNVNLRQAPTTTAASLGKLSRGTTGSVVGSPVYSYPRWWWSLQFDSGRQGWIAEEFLSDDTSVSIIGTFSNVLYTLEHESGTSIDIWRFAGSMIGLLSHSEGRLIGDTPIGKLENISFNAETKQLKFTARLTQGEHYCETHKSVPSQDIYQFDGTLTEASLSGSIRYSDNLHPERQFKERRVNLPRLVNGVAFSASYRNMVEWQKVNHPVLDFRGPRW